MYQNVVRIIPINELERTFLEPTTLSHSLIGLVATKVQGPNHFRWQNGRLFYDLPPHTVKIGDCGKHMSVVAPLTLWNEVWKVCDEIDIWSWPQDRGTHDICDGPGFWHTELAIGSRRVSTDGSLVPNSMCAGLADLPPDFKTKLLRFHRALQALTGWHEHSQEA